MYRLFLRSKLLAPMQIFPPLTFGLRAHRKRCSVAVRCAETAAPEADFQQKKTDIWIDEPIRSVNWRDSRNRTRKVKSCPFGVAVNLASAHKI